MERQPTFTNRSPERIDATELRDGADVSFNLGNPNLKSIEAARRAVADATESLKLKEVIRKPQPHEYPKSYGRSLMSLRTNKLGGASEPALQNIHSWNDFEATR